MLKFQYIRGCSSVGRVSGSHSEGRGFDSHQFHQKDSINPCGWRYLFRFYINVGIRTSRERSGRKQPK